MIFFYLLKSIFFLIEFHCIFSISYRNITILCLLLLHFVGCNRPSGLLFCARFTSFHTHTSLLTFFVCFCILFHSCCSHAHVFMKTLVHEFPISYSHIECYLFFSDSVITSAHF